MSGFGLPARTARGLLLLTALATCAAPAWSLYQIKDEKGRVIGYSDKPPAGGKATTVEVRGESGAPSATAGLPYDLQQIASRFPVTLYTRKECGGCESARSFLNQRGIPYVERTADSREDNQALRRLEGTDLLPLLRIGGQRINGFSASEWASYLDAAGYPAQSKLPSTYKLPPATPLAPAPASAPAAASAPRDSAPAQLPAGTPGFRF
ncbi:MAG: glutaredoxin family protein [Aquabacterium sp.]|jgi:glutaredoxin|nr:MAG: glutaredoxin family protein [Aquabacterium sp.]